MSTERGRGTPLVSKEDGKVRHLVSREGGKVILLVSREGGNVTALVSRWDAEGECFFVPRRGAGQSCRPYQQQGPTPDKGERDGRRKERRDGHRTGQGRGGQGGRGGQEGGEPFLGQMGKEEMIFFPGN